MKTTTKSKKCKKEKKTRTCHLSVWTIETRKKINRRKARELKKPTQFSIIFYHPSMKEKKRSIISGNLCKYHRTKWTYYKFIQFIHWTYEAEEISTAKGVFYTSFYKVANPFCKSCIGCVSKRQLKGKLPMHLFWFGDFHAYYFIIHCVWL